MIHATTMLNSSSDPRAGRTGDVKAQTDYGAEHANKPTKAVIGVAILMVLSFVLYEINGRGHDSHSTANPPVPQTIASNAH
jgi:hypothetical protein